MRTPLVVVSLTVVSFTSFAQTPPGTGTARDRREVRQDKRELKQDKRQAADDQRDQRRFTGLLALYDGAIAGGRIAEIAGLDQRAVALIDGELREGNREQGQKNAEVARSEAERRGARREVAADVGAGRPAVTAGDRRDLRDDRRDARDDRRDATLEAAQNNEVRSIRAEFAQLAGKTDRPSLDRKRALLARMVAFEGAEVRGDRREQREDRKELREDRRERREDRRGR